jgi:hypothetical protein
MDNTGTGTPTAPIYRDFDGIARRGDGDTANSIRPLLAGQGASRPVVLNRPFRSVAELGYVYRDQPWKTLDFFSAQSADAGLLDVFCLNESGKSSVVAGMVNLNSRSSSVIQSLLEGSARVYDNSVLITSADATTLANDYVNPTVRTNLVSRSDIVGSFRPTQGGASPSFTVSSAYPALKMRREAVPRSLMDLGQTRTWNLMIDIVAQAGRYTSTAKSLDQFLVEGERRFWLHLAIDRFTGKVIDQVLEPVTE